MVVQLAPSEGMAHGAEGFVVLGARQMLPLAAGAQSGSLPQPLPPLQLQLQPNVARGATPEQPSATSSSGCTTGDAALAAAATAAISGLVVARRRGRCQRHRSGVARHGLGNRRGTFLRPQTGLVSTEYEKPRPNAKDVRFCSGVAELVEHFDGFTLDQYGVLHDGREAYPEVADCLKRLHATGKPSVILSNYAGRAARQRARLPEIGLEPDLLAGVVTSGELAHRYLSRNRQKLGGGVLWIAWSAREERGLSDFFEGLEDYHLVSNVSDASFLLVSGVQCMFAGTRAEARANYERTGDETPFIRLFRAAIHKSLPMLCANPDERVMRPGGWKAYLGGSLAKVYERIGGRVIYFGKPYNAAFEEARRILGEHGVTERICHVGDSLHHDIQGATTAGLSSAFVAHPGLHSKSLPKIPNKVALERLCHKENTPVPTAVIPRFTW